MNKIKVSVIVPVYKVERCIERCVRSLMEQTMKDGIEFIFINDCTPDNSMIIIESVVAEYPDRNGQVVIVNNERNLGVFNTRKRGIELAKGEYIGWCDSDDWCEIDMFEKMCDVAFERALDIVVCNYKLVHDSKISIISLIPSKTPQEAILNSYYKRTFRGHLVIHLIKRGIYLRCRNDVVATNFGEDMFLLFHIYYYSTSVGYVNTPFYNYWINNKTSLTHSIDWGKSAWLVQQENLERIERLYYQNNGWKKFHVTINALIFERKCLYGKAFDSGKEFFYTFKRASKDILRFYDWRKLSSWEMYLCHNYYFLYRLANQPL